jgi:UPF0271 protein
MTTIDLNSDLGESYGAFKIGFDEELFPLISSANVACGFHGGDPATLVRTVQACKAHGVAVGAHPGFPDLVGFGRRTMGASASDVFADTLYQLGALDAICRAYDVKMQHVKPHGALNNMMAHDRGLADALVEAVARFDPTLLLFAMPGSELLNAGEARGLTIVREAFADRAYNPNGTLVSRSVPGAMITDPGEAAARILNLAMHGAIETIDGSEYGLTAGTVCTHSDTPGAVAIVTAVRAALLDAGISIGAPGVR